ncbi:MAG: Nif3-like dinuclear metal center hexameric protein [Methanomicrobium sp.]|nr:Nif3-like dinuclear metal center hexameric protein [Methanomicrobium sp.]
MDIADFIRKLEDIAPPEIAEDMDDGKIGLVIEGKREITRAACALDATKNTVAKAADMGADILVVHHPPIWHAVHRITGLKRDIFLPAFKAEMNIYSMHTNFDHARGGINDALGEFLELKNIGHMSLGVIGDCTMSLKEISQKLGGSMRVYGDIGRLEGKTFRLAVVGGSGFDAELIDEAKDAGADVFLSAELKHDTVISQDIILAESTHYDLESIGMKKLAEKTGWTFIEDRPQRHDI